MWDPVPCNEPLHLKLKVLMVCWSFSVFSVLLLACQSHDYSCLIYFMQNHAEEARKLVQAIDGALLTCPSVCQIKLFKNYLK